MQVDFDDDNLQRDDQLELDLEEEMEDAEVDEEEEGQPSDSETDSDAEHEGKDGADEDEDDDELDAKSQAKVQERIGELTRKRHEAERRAKELEEQLEQFQAESHQASKPQVDELPDPDEVSAEEMTQAVQRREQQLRKLYEWEVQNQSLTQRQQERQTRTQQEQIQQLQSAAQQYNKRAQKLGVKPEELQQSAQVLNQVGLHNDVAQHLLEHEVGPAIVRHLAKNADDLLEVAGMTPLKAALYIEQKIAPKIKGTSRKSSARKPAKRVKGGTPNRNKDKFPLTGGRATFE